MKVTFSGVEYKVEVKVDKHLVGNPGEKTQTLSILKNAKGVALPGETCFIMGSSGCGKTSLLNVLSDRISTKKGNIVNGKVFINDSIPLTMNAFGKIGAYVMQDDILFQFFTPLEALTFAARLRLNSPIEKQNEIVSKLLKDLGLVSVQNTIIGSAIKKSLSGGERKRTAIGVELVTDPSIILLDEPTSGLDSFKALEIVRLLRRLSREGKTVISTIHQPSSNAFMLFDRLMLMCDGHIVY